MSKPEVDPAEAINAVACPLCGAGRGQFCATTDAGDVLSAAETHKARLDAYAEKSQP